MSAVLDAAYGWPAPMDRDAPKVLGLSRDGRRELIGLDVADARYHLHVQGVTGVGKSTWLTGYVIAEAIAGRGVALIDCMGDLAQGVLDRLPRWCAERLVILDAAETAAPPAFNPLAPDTMGADPEWSAEHVTGVFRALYAKSWGPRMHDYMRGACLTLAPRPGSTVFDILTLLTDPAFRAHVLATVTLPRGLGTLWEEFDSLSPGARAQVCGPLISRLRGVHSRRFARDLLASPTSTFDLTEILDGGILIVRIPKGELGEETSRLIGSLLLAGLWAHTTRRASRTPEQRPDASIVVDEAHNMLHLPIGVEEALAESRGYRTSWVLAHQHQFQLPRHVAAAISANCRNKLLFKISPEDAGTLAPHFAPYLSAHDLSARPAYQISARTVHHGQDQPPFTLDALPLPAPIPGRAEWLRRRVRARIGLTKAHREAEHKHAVIQRSLRAASARVPTRPPAVSAPTGPRRRPRDGRTVDRSGW
ncbi:type IV secretory system conjugative DNA transfer family protein [Pseudonocardia sp. Cha107L01]|uniref:type IV secretory system conjugative DNA transfer family protein n=1 Tax=Pseudonocardia sp. Cha107L01 TaxID=3457576 RepID=UPI00403ED3BC